LGGGQSRGFQPAGFLSHKEKGSMARDREEGKGFRVQDRRRFSPESGEPREELDDEVRQTTQKEPEAANSGDELRPSEGGALPEINFSTFVISLSTQALMHLGEIPNPLDGKLEKDFAVAKQMIDIINILSEKTRGNLDQGEQTLLEDVLYNLRMRYVEVVKKG
jgi:hypothetical protein